MFVASSDGDSLATSLHIVCIDAVSTALVARTSLLISPIPNIFVLSLIISVVDARRCFILVVDRPAVVGK